MACKISLVVPNLKLTQLEWFFHQNWPLLREELKSRCFQLIIVTSAVKKTEIEAWKAKYPGVQWVTIVDNCGFASTVNTGFALGGGEWLATANDDVILSKGWWQACLSVADDKTGSINPVILNQSGEVESAGIRVLPQGKAEALTKIQKSGRAVVDATNGAAVLYRRDLLKNIGYFNQCFGSYLEDIDLSLRIKKVGFQNVVCFDASIIHYGHASGYIGVRKSWHDTKNWWLIVLSHWTAREWLTHAPSIALERGRNLSGLFKSLFR